jgi:enterochelin esterase-like enzyme
VARVRPFAEGPRGRIEQLRHRSRVLENNPWDDPVERDFPVYLPPGYDPDGPPHVALWDLAAFTNSGIGHLNWRNQGENLVQRLDRLIGQGHLPPVVVPMPDCFTSLGGNQYINSPGVGAYADYLVEELVPLVGEQFNVIDGPAGRGAFGKSSGGYGALRLAMAHPEIWGGIAMHAADCGFDWVYRPELPTACLVLAEYNGDPLRFLEVFWRNRKVGGRDFSVLMTLAMAATYDPDPEQPDRIRLPMDIDTCELDPERWARWLEHDPLNLVEDHVDVLRGLHCLYLDVGRRDQYRIQFGTRRLSALLEKSGIDHHFEEFEGTHSQMDWRLDTSLPLLANALVAASKAQP